ncbi:hypothetical protein BC829DRAFT_391250 [Chytridium lagenaria]|nr:hypothetical protein BC829DRAFT_391250 [Chytridium lagenaria]
MSMMPGVNSIDGAVFDAMVTEIGLTKKQKETRKRNERRRKAKKTIKGNAFSEGIGNEEEEEDDEMWMGRDVKVKKSLVEAEKKSSIKTQQESSVCKPVVSSSEKHPMQPVKSLASVSVLAHHCKNINNLTQSIKSSQQASKNIALKPVTQDQPKTKLSNQTAASAPIQKRVVKKKGKSQPKSVAHAQRDNIAVSEKAGTTPTGNHSSQPSTIAQRKMDGKAKAVVKPSIAQPRAASKKAASALMQNVEVNRSKESLAKNVTQVETMDNADAIKKVDVVEAKTEMNDEKTKVKAISKISPAQPATQSANGAPISTSTFKKHDRRRKVMCNYAMKGFCKKGKACPYLHPAAAIDVAVAAEGVEKEEVLPYGKCRFGDKEVKEKAELDETMVLPPPTTEKDQVDLQVEDVEVEATPAVPDTVEVKEMETQAITDIQLEPAEASSEFKPSDASPINETATFTVQDLPFLDGGLLEAIGIWNVNKRKSFMKAVIKMKMEAEVRKGEEKFRSMDGAARNFVEDELMRDVSVGDLKEIGFWRLMSPVDECGFGIKDLQDAIKLRLELVKAKVVAE